MQNSLGKITNLHIVINSSVEQTHIIYQKQPSIGVLIKRFSENMQQIYRRTPMTMFDFNNVALQHY